MYELITDKFSTIVETEKFKKLLKSKQKIVCDFDIDNKFFVLDKTKNFEFKYII